MQKHLWLYPLLFTLMSIALMICLFYIGWMLAQTGSLRSYAGAQLVREVCPFVPC